MKLSKLLHNCVTISVANDIDITGLSLNSKAVKPGDLFFAFPGVTTDGRKFIDDAIKRGAVAVLAEIVSAESYDVENKNVPIFYLKDLAFTCGKIAAQFYDHPSKKLRVIGVTGTNGKTSCTHFIAAAFTQLGIKAAVMGTIGNGIYGESLVAQAQTTLDPLSIQRFLAEIVEQEVKIIAMEVSSHALIQGRVRGVQFAAAVFTNLTQDHLDYHGDMESYWASKRKLFTEYDVPHMVINGDDERGSKLINDLIKKKNVSIIEYSRDTLREPMNYGDIIEEGTRNVPLQVYSEQVILSCHGTQANIQTPWGEGELIVKQIGRFNLSNILAVLATMGSLGVPLDDILQSLKNLPLVPGRLQTFNAKNKPLIVVDYAHTPDALRNVLSTLRENCEGKLWCVFGCGGDRDMGKRAIMGSIAEQLADHVIIADDNPRTEDPQIIVKQIVAGLTQKKTAIINHDRKAAIQYAIDHGKKDDIILVAGKGHEDYQEIGKERHHYSDIETVNDLLGLFN